LPEVTRPGHHRKRDGIVIHRSVLQEDEVAVVDGIPVTSPFRTIFDLAGTLSTRRQLERAMNEAEVRQLRDRVSLPMLLERYPRRRGSPWVRALLAPKEPGGITRNDFEELFVAFIDEHKLPRPQLNTTLALRGRFFEPDCMWRAQRLVVELDGRAVHGTDRAFEDDRQRDRILLAEGWRWARVTWRQLRDEPAAVADDLRAALYP
jgi:very-short-patch-repair endonuclease